MKKYFLLALVALIMNNSTQAAVGDTTWVQANIANLDGYGNYDTMATFPAPGTTYRKIYMIFTLGKHTCPGYTYGTGSVPWCGDWDYTVLNYLMTPGGDTLELARFITPYANNGAPRTPYTWTQRYVYDVTDYAYLLHDAATMRILYSGYSGGFTANVKFAFIEGTPDRNVTKVRRLWTGSYNYNDTTHLDSFDINTHFTARTDTVPTGTVATDLKFLVTGHGNDANGCCEFESHNYQVMLNGTSVANKAIWRTDCGRNELYPQSGTWLLLRGNWCPGAMVYPNFHPLAGLTPGTGFDVAIEFDHYARGGSYTTEAQLIHYGAMNKTLDASLDDIIAPSNDQNHYRENPISNNPIIHVKNTGSTTIDSIRFSYGITGYPLQSYTWIGSLASLQETDVNLPAMAAFGLVAGVSGTYSFTCTIASVNGTTDNDASNNAMSSSFVSAPVWSGKLKLMMKTSNINSYSSATLAQTSWVIYDKTTNAIVKQRSGCALATIYTDTAILDRGFYRLAIYDSAYDDGNYFGLNWWALSGAGYTPGYFTIRPVGGALLTMNGYYYSGNYNNDFGQVYSQDFYVAASLPVTNINENTAALDVYPNPAQSMVNVDISGIENAKGKLELTDMAGRVVLSTACTDAHSELNTERLAGGMYVLTYVNEATGSRAQTKLVIAR